MENTNHQRIKDFIKQRGYSYTVDDILRGYQKRKDGWYNSFTMNDCLDNLKHEIESIS